MAAFLVISGPDGAKRVLDDARRDAVIRAMHERSGGAVTELAVSGATGWHCGRDGMLAVHDGVLLAVDGVPSIITSRSANGIPPRLTPADWCRPGKDLLPSLDGGFALAAYDPASRELVLARDRFGVRPLFWARKGGLIYAASEVKILAAAGIDLRVSAEALQEVLACRWLVRDRSLFDAVRQVPPASCLVSGPGLEPSVRRYWQLQFSPEPAGPDALPHYRDQARDAMRSAILEIAGERQVIGVLLSGGVDSSVIAGAAREVVGKVVGFAGRLPGDSNQELDRASIVARHLGIECRVVDIQLPDFDGDLRTLADAWKSHHGIRTTSCCSSCSGARRQRSTWCWKATGRRCCSGLRTWVEWTGSEASTKLSGTCHGLGARRGQGPCAGSTAAGRHACRRC